PVPDGDQLHGRHRQRGHYPPGDHGRRPPAAGGAVRPTAGGVMTRRCQTLRRRGAVTVETAIVLPVLCLLVFGLIVGGMGVSRYQLVAFLSREAARYAAVRGADWQRETGQASPTQQQITDTVVAPLAVSMDPAG